MTCEICGNESKMFAWTDTHGVAQCLQCGTPYVLYHYEGEGNERRRIEKEPEIAVRDEWVPLLREYWEKEHRTIPGGHSFPGGQEMASQADEEAFSTWVDSNKARISNLGKQDVRWLDAGSGTARAAWAADYTRRGEVMMDNA